MIFEQTVEDILSSDSSNDYQIALNRLAFKYPHLRRWAKKVEGDVNFEVLNALEIVVRAGMDADGMQGMSKSIKTAGFINRMMIKALKIAQKILAVLLLKSPFKIGIAYNALHNAIKFLELQAVPKVIKG